MRVLAWSVQYMFKSERTAFKTLDIKNKLIREINLSNHAKVRNKQKSIKDEISKAIAVLKLAKWEPKVKISKIVHS